MITDSEILQAAILGYQSQIGEIEAKIGRLKEQLGRPEDSGTRAKRARPVSGPVDKSRRTMSAAARKAIGAAQKRRWAKWKQARESA
jgi:hypothetical protein